MKVLVVGGAGYIGGAVTTIALEYDYDVIVFDSLVYEEAYRKLIDFVRGDIRDRKLLGSLLKDVDCVIWLAALVGDGACAINPPVSKELNQDSVEWLSKNYCGRIIFPSTCSVYGAQEGMLSEESPTNPLSVYASTKLAAEQYLKDKDAIIFRLGTIFGVGDLFSRIRMDLVVNTMTARAALNEKISVYGGTQFRPLMHVRDVAQVMVDAVEKENTGIYNVHKNNVMITDLAYQVRNHFTGIDIEIIDIAPQDMRDYKVNSDKAIKELSFNPTINIDTGIEEIKELVCSGRLVNVNNKRYSNQQFLSENYPRFETS